MIWSDLTGDCEQPWFVQGGQRVATSVEHYAGGKMSEQRIPFSVRQEALSGLKDWWTDRIATSAFNHLCGNVAQADTRYTGGNATVAPDSTHHIWSSVDHTTDQTLDATDPLSLSEIDRCVTLAETLTPAIRPVMIRGKKHYVLFVHPYQAYSLRTSTTTGQWLDIQKAAMQGGEVTNNPIFNGALGMYNDTIIRKDSRITLGCNSGTGVAVANTRRAVFCGAQSLSVAFGQEGGPSKFTWVEELFDSICGPLRSNAYSKVGEFGESPYTAFWAFCPW